MKKIGTFILDTVEIYVPMVTFFTMFVVFVINVFFRYVLNHPLTWPFELQRYTYIWTLLFGGAFAKRTHAHVSFSLLYDIVTPKKQAFIRIFGNTLVAIMFCFAVYPSYDIIQFYGYHKSTVLRIPYNIIFFPFLIFSVLIIGHCIFDAIIDVKKLVRKDI